MRCEPGKAVGNCPLPGDRARLRLYFMSAAGQHLWAFQVGACCLCFVSTFITLHVQVMSAAPLPSFPRFFRRLYLGVAMIANLDCFSMGGGCDLVADCPKPFSLNVSLICCASAAARARCNASALHRPRLSRIIWRSVLDAI